MRTDATRRAPLLRALWTVAGLLLAAAGASAQDYKLSHALPPGPDGGDVQELRVSPDGSRVVYRADGETYGVFELFSAPTDGSAAPVKLNDTLDDYCHVAAGGFSISPDGSRVLYRASRDYYLDYLLYSVPIDGFVGPVVLSDGVVSDYRISADGQRVAYLSDQTTWHQYEVFGALIDGSGGWAPLNGTLPGFASASRVEAAGARVVYIADVVADNRYDLFSVPFDGSSAPLQLTNVPISNFVTEVRVSPDGSTAVFVQRAGTTYTLRSVPVDGSAAPVLLTPTTYSLVASFGVAPGGTRAVYLALTTAGGPVELFSVPLDASAAPVRLNPAFVAGRAVVQYGVTSDGLRALYVADQAADELFELWSAPLDGSAAAVRLNGTPVAGGDVAGVSGVALVSAGERVVYVADQDTAGVLELYAVPADGSAAATKLSGVLSSASVHPYSLDPAIPTDPFGADRARALFALDTQVGPDTVTELFSVPVDASAAPVPVSGALVSGGDVFPGGGWAFTGAQVLYVADQDTDETRDLYAAPLDGSVAPTRLDGALAPKPPDTQVLSAPQITSDSQRVVYSFAEAGGPARIYSVPPDGSSPPVDLSGPLSYVTTDFELTSDGARALHWDFPPGGPLSLYSFPTDGSAAPVLLFSGTMVAGAFTGPARVTPACDQVVFRANQQIVRVAIDGGTPVFLTSAPASQSQAILGAEISSDGARVVFLQDRDVASRVELYSVPLDGSAGPTKLNPTLPATGDVSQFALSPEGATVVYVADQAVDFRDELYAVPIGGGSAQRLNGTIVSGGSVRDFQIAPGGTRVAYVADQEVPFRNELYSVPLAGGSVVKLNGSVVTGGGLSGIPGQYAFTPDSKRVLFIAVQDTAGTPELYSVLAAGGARLKLNGPLVAGGSVTAPLRFSPDGQFVVFRADDEVENTFELFSRRVDGSLGPRKLNGPIVSGGNVFAFAVAPGGRRVLYLSSEENRLNVRPYSVGILGGARTELNGPLVPRGDVADFVIAPDGRHLAYRADQEYENTYELYGIALEPPQGKIRLR